MALIQLEDIWKSFGAYDVLTGIYWQIDPGERIGLVGPNGCGKTTLLRIITEESLPDRGSCTTRASHEFLNKNQFARSTVIGSHRCFADTWHANPSD